MSGWIKNRGRARSTIAVPTWRARMPDGSSSGRGVTASGSCSISSREGGDVIHVPRAGTYYVGGLVEHPGSFLLKLNTRLDQAIVAAGGVKDYADWGDIRIYRVKPGGEREILTFDLGAIEKGEQGPEIQKNDVVIVGKSQTKAFWYGLLDFLKGRVGSVGFGF